MRVFRSVGARLTLWYTLILSVPLAVFAIASYATFSSELHERTDAFIGDALAAVGREAGAERRVNRTFEEAVRVTVDEVRFEELDVIVLDGNGALLGMSHPREVARPAADSAVLHDFVRSAARAGREIDSTAILSSGAYRLLARPQTVGGQYAVIGGAYPMREVATMLARLRRMYWIAIPLLIAAAATGGWFLAKRSFAPVTAMAGRAAEIGATTLHERLPIVADDELGALARVLNDLLNRLDGSFQQQRRFMADASHELRTPAAVLRAEADITLSRPTRSEAEYRESMQVVQDAARRLTRIVDDIFLLARADAGHLVMHRAPVDLHDVVVDSVRAVQSIASARNIRIQLRTPVEASVHGDADLLGRVLLNLLDNAVKHSYEGSEVEVRMATLNGGGSAEVSVVDAGPGIPADARERVFERFYRVDTARSRAENTITSGAGLGLAIARRIAEMHGGQVELAESRPGRTEFRFRVPTSAGEGT